MTTIVEQVNDEEWNEEREVLERKLFEASAALLAHTNVDMIEMIGDDFTVIVKLILETNDDTSETRTLN